MTVFFIILFIPPAIYFCLLCRLALITGKKLKRTSIGIPDPKPVSIIIAARNESSGIKDLISCIASQQYPAGKYEAILSDDHSTDDTVAKAIEEAQKHQVTLSLCFPEKRGKRNALNEAIQQANHQWIAFTDADCRPMPGWLDGLTRPLVDEKIVLVLGTTDMAPAHGWFGRMQAAEYQSIAAMTAATALAGIPVMANGASMLIRADVYKKAIADGYQKNYLSGDDMFLLQYIKEKYGSGGIAFQPGNEVRVVINPEPSWAAFARQRLRWVSKAGGYTDPAIKGIAALVAITGISIIMAVIIALANPSLWWLPVTLYAVKSLADIPLLFLWSRHTCKIWLVASWFIPLQLGYPFFSTGFGVTGLIARIRWE